MTTNTTTYWDRFYSEKSFSEIDSPSQFALVVARDIDSSLVVDIGAGSGRDSIYFANKGHSVIAIDGSVSALGSISRRSLYFKMNKNLFETNFSSQDHVDELFTRISEHQVDGELVILYSRFFLHAISSEAEVFLLEFMSKFAVGTKVMFEFRLLEVDFVYTFGEHFRRRIDLIDFLPKCESIGYNTNLVAISREFAVYGNEKPLVARYEAIKIV
jgi:tellurite methyltransferase